MEHIDVSAVSADWDDAGASTDFAEGELVGLALGGREVLVTRVDNRLYALHNICSHADAWLDGGDLHADTLEVECPLHGGCFDLRSGQATAPPCVAAIASYPVGELDGRVRIDLTS